MDYLGCVNTQGNEAMVFVGMRCAGRRHALPPLESLSPALRWHCLPDSKPCLWVAFGSSVDTTLAGGEGKGIVIVYSDNDSIGTTQRVTALWHWGFLI